VEYFEDPTYWQVMPRLKLETGLPLALDYMPYMIDSLDAIFELSAIDVLVLKPSRAGGISKTLSLSKRAFQAGVHTVISSNLETGVGITSCLNLAAITGSELAHGLDTLDLLEDSLIDQDWPIANGYMSMSQEKGLGVTLSRSASDFLQRVSY
jgi:L-alanine-DL-glutamate epimerase-like enolase superfamily enzyme